MVRFYNRLLSYISVFFPYITVYGAPIYPALFIFNKNVKFINSVIKNSKLPCYLPLALMYALSLYLFRNDIYREDVLLFAAPLLLVFLSHCFVGVSMRDRGLVVLKSYILIQFSVVLIQKTGAQLPLLDELIKFNSVEVAKSDTWYIRQKGRPGGTIAHPVWMTLTAYLFSKVIDVYRDEKKYLYLVILMAVISAARTSIVAIVIAESIILCVAFTKGTVTLSSIRKGLIALTCGLVLSYVAFQNSSLFQQYIKILSSGTSYSQLVKQDYSFTYRSEMYSGLLSNISCVPFGCYSNNTLGVMFPYIDSELVHRAYQIGIIGLALIVFFVMLVVARCIDRIELKISLGAVIGASVFTTYFFTNMYMVWSLALFLAYSYTLREDNYVSQNRIRDLKNL